MPSYERLDRIADAYNPILLVAWLLLVGHALHFRRWRVASASFVLGLSTLFVAYGAMWLDAALGIWLRMGFDDSTHTAVALALCTVLWTLSRRSRIAVAVSLAAYCMLMLYQRYHTPADIASTLLILAAPIAGVAWLNAPWTRVDPSKVAGGSPPRGAG